MHLSGIFISGVAFSGLQGKVLYPMISSTAARSGMNLVFCRSYAPTLQLQTMLSLGKQMLLPDNVSLFKVLPDNIVPPGLKVWMKNNFWWITSNREEIRIPRKQGKKYDDNDKLIDDNDNWISEAVNSDFCRNLLF